MTVSRPAAVVILAAGAGTRMKSQLPKVLHPICGAAMLDHVLAAARELSPAELIVVVGHGRRQVAAHLARMRRMCAWSSRNGRAAQGTPSAS